MKILVVGGCSAGVGKTTLACRILEALGEGWGALKVSPVRPHACSGTLSCGECHGLRAPYELRTNAVDLLEPGSDTSRYRSSGAHPVAWLIASEAGLAAGLREAVASLATARGIVVEGNAAAAHLERRRLVVVARAGLEEVKPSARLLLGEAEPMVLNRPAARSGTEDAFKRLERLGARRIRTLDAALASDPGTAAFLDEIRAWARR